MNKRIIFLTIKRAQKTLKSTNKKSQWYYENGKQTEQLIKNLRQMLKTV